MQHTHRLSQLRETLVREGMTALLLTDPLHVTYLTGFTGDSSFLLVTVSRMILISDSRFEIQIAEECPGLDTAIRDHTRNTWQEAARVLESCALREVAVESGHLTLNDLARLRGLSPLIEFVPIDGWLQAQRAIKDAGEIGLIRRAIQQGEQALAMLRQHAQPEWSEKHAAQRLEQYLHEVGADERSFPIIIGVGARSALPHAPPLAEVLLGTSPFYLIDWGAKTSGYHGDTTRVMATPDARNRFDGSERGRVEKQLATLYTTVLYAQRAAATAVRPGVSVKEVDAAARAVIDAAGWGDHFNHGLGHGVGLQIHESPSIRGNSDDVLQAGMVITLEPGVYLPDFGGVRIEDTFLITAEGCERLNALPHEWEYYFA